MDAKPSSPTLDHFQPCRQQSARFLFTFHRTAARRSGRVRNFPNVIIDDLSSANIGPEQNAPQSYTQNVYQLADTINFIRGPHTFKIGVEGKKYIAPTNVLSRGRGEWDYDSLSQPIPNDYVPTGRPTVLSAAQAQARR